ncbi:response regulator [Teredinibacter franksiae]|uniref:response regulator n=1 Tax=Teredinibacter franksiae TaxID=2761453 RepID=UPI0016247C19|nr:response regulator [Teredinibacter franksiae]
MQLAEKKQARSLRRFKIAIVGAGKGELDAISRIFTVTNYRTRSYEPVEVSLAPSKLDIAIDFVLICSQNPNVIHAWINYRTNNRSGALSVPFVYLTKFETAELGRYQLVSPVNPSKFIKLLDQYTIRELNFLPEFEIGAEDTPIENDAISGLRILRANKEKRLASSEVQTRVLVVDDSLAVRKQMEIEFSLRDNQLDVASNAEEALSIMQGKKYDAIFMDVVMPGIDGYSACKKIKKDALNKDTPVIMLTSRSSSFDKIKGALAGCAAYLVKPINHNEFEDVYNKYVCNSVQGVK